MIHCPHSGLEGRERGIFVFGTLTVVVFMTQLKSTWLKLWCMVMPNLLKNALRSMLIQARYRAHVR